MVDYNYTPEALCKRLSDASVIYSRFLLLVSQHGEDAVYCFVEGYDMPYYRAIVRSVVRKEPLKIRCSGKAGVIAANLFIEEREDCRKYTKRYFVDRDYDSNEKIPVTIFVTDGYSIENYYLSEACVGAILEIEFKMSKSVYSKEYQKCMNLFRQEHRIFFEATLLFNAWYSCLYQSLDWDRSEVTLDNRFPKEWLNLIIGNIRCNYTLPDIEEKYDKVPKIDKTLVLERVDKLKALGPSCTRGKYEMQFLFEFLSFLKNEPKKNRLYTVASCSLPFQQNSMISTFSQYADVTDNLFNYIKTGKRCPFNNYSENKLNSKER